MINTLYHPKILFLLVGFLLSTLALFSQNIVLEHDYYNVEDGLAHREVFSVKQDDVGYIWLGTKMGLQRYDGSSFKYFTKDSHGLNNNEINYIFKDNSGLLWLIHTGSHNNEEIQSIDLFDPSTQKLIPSESIFTEEFQSKIPNITHFSFNENGEIIFITNNFQTFFYKDFFESSNLDLDENIDLIDINLSYNKEYWLSYHLPFLNYHKGSIELLNISSDGKTLARHQVNNVRYLYIYSIEEDGTIHFLKQNEDYSSSFFLIDNQGSIIENIIMNNLFYKEHPAQLPFGETVKVKVHGDFIWMMLSYEEFLVFDKYTFQKVDLTKLSEEGLYITDVYFDNNGNSWICTLFGLHRVNLFKSKFMRILQNEETNSFPTRGITTDDDNNLWVIREARKYIWKYNNKTGESEKVLEKGSSQIDKTSGNSFLALESSKSGEIIFSSSNDLIFLDPVTEKVRIIKISDDIRNVPFIWEIFEDSKGNVWFSNDVGEIGYFNGSDIVMQENLGDKEGNIITYQILEKPNGLFWIVTDSGIYVLDSNEKSIIERYWTGGRGKFHLKFDNLYHIYEEGDSSIWLATKSNGLIHWFPNRENDNVIQFTREQGLSNNTIYCIYPDGLDHLWITSDFGIMRFNKNTYQVQTYLKEKGISHNEFNRISHYQGKDNIMYFGGLNGITSFNPKAFQSDKVQKTAPLVITDYVQRDENGYELKDSERDLFQSDRIIFNPGDRFFRLEFKLLTYSNYEKNTYAYKIDNVDKEWTYQKENSIRINRLPYGNHKLRIKGQLSDGTWSSQELSIDIFVIEPFYSRTSFIILLILFILFLILAIYKLKLTRLKATAVFLENEVTKRTKKIRKDKLMIEKQAESLKSLDKIKSNFFANVSHELRTPLTLISGPISKLLQNNERSSQEIKLLKIIEKNSNLLKKLVNEILDLSKLEDSQFILNEDEVDFYPFIQNIVEAFRPLIDGHKIIFNTYNRLDRKLLLKLDKLQFEKVLNNLLSNAFKFTPSKGLIEVSVKETESNMIISVSDSGIGISQEDLPHIFNRYYQSKDPNAKTEGGSGIGLALCKQLVNLMDGKISVQSEKGRGSKFEISIPKKVVLKHELQTVIINNNKDSNIESERVDIAIDKELINMAIPNQKTQNILIVEDNSELREYYKIILDSYNIYSSKNGLEALSLLKKGINPDIIICDIMMPVMDGIEFLLEVKKSEKWSHIPFMMVTAKFDRNFKISALRYGVDDYISKPFDEEELLIRIRNMLQYQVVRKKFISASLSITDSNNENFIENSSAFCLSESDLNWLEKFEVFIVEHLGDDLFSVSIVAKEFIMSESTLLRKLKKLTGLSSKQYIQEIRLNKAKELIETDFYKTMSQVAFHVGYKDYTAFSRSFKSRFGISPSKLQKKM